MSGGPVWAAPIAVGVGNRIAGVRTVPDQHDELAQLLGPWVVDAPPQLPAVFDVVIHETAAPVGRLVPQLRYGSCVIARARSAEPIVDALLQMLGDVGHTEQPLVPVRLFTRDDRCVVAALPAATFLPPDPLRRHGVSELTTLGVRACGREVSVVPALGTAGASMFTLVGIIEMSDTDQPSPATSLAMRAPTAEWLATVERMAADDRVVRCSRREEAVQHLVSWLGAPA